MFPVDFTFKNKESNTCLVNVQYIMIMHFFLLRFFQVLKGCSFKFPVKVGVEESIVNGQQI
jgi:hypothetical protein